MFIVLGVLLKKFPVKKISKCSGYSTPTSRKSQEVWDYAQVIAPKIALNMGLILFLVMAVLTLLNLTLEKITITINFISLFIYFAIVEGQLKKKFS